MADSGSVENFISMLLLSSTSWQFVIFIVQSGLVIWGMLVFKSFIARELAWQAFRTNLNIKLGTKVKVAVGNVVYSGHITDVTRRRIVVKSEYELIFVPLKSFSDEIWVVETHCNNKVKK